MRAVSLGEHAADATREMAARSAFRSAGVTHTREQVVLVAPESVVRAADEAFQRLRDLRDLIGQGQTLPGYEPALMAYGDGLQALRDAIRKDLGVEPLRIRVPL
jgi:hypothetical protein